MNAPFYNKIKQYAEDKSVRRFHMPGHKGKADLGFDPIMKYDVTEVERTDNLYFPQDSLIEAEKLAAKLFDVKTTIFCAGGATLGNQTALSFFQKKKVLFERNIHISAFNATMLLDIEPVFVYNKTDRETGVVLPIEANDIETALEKNNDISAVFLTSPNYYGLCTDCEEIKKICNSYGVTLIVDNSHGAHLKFAGNENDEATKGNHCADIIIDSAHKTLPVLTGGAFIHFNIDVNREDVCARMLAFGSTSPSFLILSSLDFARAWCEENREKFKATRKKIEEMKQRLKNNGITVVSSKIYDPLRLCIAASNADEIDEELQKRSIIPEMCSGQCVVFMFSPFNSEDEIDLLEKTLIELSPKAPMKTEDFSFPKTNFVCSPKDAYFGQTAEIDVKNAVGRTAARSVIPYPPGVPILFPGEQITEQTANYLIKRKTEKVKVI